VPKPRTGKDPIPVKGGVLRYLLDERTKLKTPSKDLVFDAAFHPSIMEECFRDTLLDKMMVSLLLEYAEKFAGLIVLDKEECKKVKINVIMSINCHYNNNNDNVVYFALLKKIQRGGGGDYHVLTIVITESETQYNSMPKYINVISTKILVPRPLSIFFVVTLKTWEWPEDEDEFYQELVLSPRPRFQHFYG
jgi:hypothetical protein